MAVNNTSRRNYGPSTLVGWTCPMAFSQCDITMNVHGRARHHSYLHAGSTTTTATSAVGTDSSGNQVITADGGSLAFA